MLSNIQIKEFSRIYKISDSVVVREYFQILFLKELYDENFSKYIYFKGGTAIRLLFSGTRFSEDLDFTVTAQMNDFDDFIKAFFAKLMKLYEFNFKKRDSTVGQKYLLTVNDKALRTSVFISLDFSFREKVLDPDKSILNTSYPVIFTSFVNHLSQAEILSEKVRALLTREKGRDLYDLWYLLTKNTEIRIDFIIEKLKYYNINSFEPKDLLSKLDSFNREKFVLDLRPFVAVSEREKLAGFFDYTIAFLKDKFLTDS